MAGAAIGKVLRRDSRAAVVAWALWTVRVKATFTYTEGPQRWLWVEGTDPGHRFADCSAHAIGCRRHAGSLDLTKTAWSYGNTETLLAHGIKIPRGQAIQGDICVLGAEWPVSDQHAVTLVSRGKNPLVVSHGMQGCPCLGHLDDDPRSKTFLRFPTVTPNKIVYPPKA